ncbi:MAG: hypothetical protein U5J83_15035 [Bryobacterales bacterium]|nr:hypothetical protein [Bryobacterales bacterium]
MGTKAPFRRRPKRSMEAAELRVISPEAVQLALDITDVDDPTPVSDGLNALNSLGTHRDVP